MPGSMPLKRAARSSAIYKGLAIVATFWFFVVLNSYIIWNSLAPVTRLLAAFAVIGGTFLLPQKLTLPKKRRFIFLFGLIYYFWILLVMSDSIAEAVRISTEYIPLLCIFLWPIDLLDKVYVTIRKVVIFFAIGSAIVSVLILIGLGNKLPHLVLPPREALHERLGVVYYLYGLFIADCRPVLGVSSRACGMLQEPGHFAILLGFIYLIDRFSHRKINAWLVICGLLTFSSTFVLIVLFTELRNIFTWKFLKKFLIALPLLVLSVAVVIRFLPQDLREEIEYYAYGRNLEKVVEAFNESSSLDAALDERASGYSIANYEKLSTTQRLFGGGYKDVGYALSDYRGLILDMGILGMALAIVFFLAILSHTPFSMKIALGLSFFLIVLHRSWMLYPPYIFFLAFIAVLAFRSARREQLIHSLSR